MVASNNEVNNSEMKGSNLSNRELKCALEAILFANGAPVHLETLSKALEIKSTLTKQLLTELMEEYAQNTHGIAVIRLEESYQMCNKKEYGEFIRRVMDLKRNAPLSQAALEVLAVIAYNQPVTKAFVEQVRGVDCSGVVGSLTTKGLIEEKGRLELPGRPLLYGTTENFLRCFQLESLDDLPPLPQQENDNPEDNSNNEADSNKNISEDTDDNGIDL
ncbi:MAG: SMC-Scp complex subunit ScpB [Acutalibacteraceae bacterium]|nr:SMC-Scp complex subunit ScpB [Acutalibacteraceae bacterium]